MLTIKLPYKLINLDNKNVVSEMIKQYNHILKSAIKLLQKDLSQKAIYSQLCNHNNINYLNSRLILIAIGEAKSILDSAIELKKRQDRTNNNLTYKDIKIVVKKSNFIKRLKGKLTKEEFLLNKHLPINFEGEKLQKGNRNIGFNIANNQIYIKQGAKQSKRIYLQLPILRGKHKQALLQLEYLANNYLAPTSVKLDLNYVYFVYSETLIKKSNQIENRIMGIDLNPNFIGLSIVEYKSKTQNIIHTKLIDLSELNKNKNRNKVNHELIEICKSIEKIARHFKVSCVFSEDLRTLTPKNHKKGIKYNQLINNTWNRRLVINNIYKRCFLNGITFHIVNPKFSSYIGNLQHEYHDAVNASIEIGRRGYELKIKKNANGIYPKKIELSTLTLHRWKEMDANTNLNLSSWESLFAQIKNSKMKYRVQLNEAHPHNAVFRKRHNTTEYTFR